MIENATIPDYITIDEKMHTSANDGHLFTQYEKYIFYTDEILHHECFPRLVFYYEQNLIQLLVMFTDMNLSATFVGLYILTSSMT